MNSRRQLLLGGARQRLRIARHGGACITVPSRPCPPQSTPAGIPRAAGVARCRGTRPLQLPGRQAPPPPDAILHLFPALGRHPALPRAARPPSDYYSAVTSAAFFPCHWLLRGGRRQLRRPAAPSLGKARAPSLARPQKCKRKAERQQLLGPLLRNNYISDDNSFPQINRAWAIKIPQG